MGTFSRSWDLLRQSFAVLKSDEQLMWLPILSAVFCLFATVIISGGGLLAVLPPGPLPSGAAQQKLIGQQMAPFMFLWYVATYSIVTYFNVALVGLALDRLGGGHATLSDGLQMAWERKWSIFQWALLSATVGMLLQALERRLGLLGRITTRTAGLIWSLASFFVTPLLAVHNMGPVEALYKSAQLFRKTWGDQVVGRFSFGAVFLVLAIPGIILPMLAATKLGPAAVVPSLGVLVVYWLLLAVISSAAWGIFIAALYRYADSGQVSGGFQLHDLSRAWQPKESTFNLGGRSSLDDL